jgi:hypothetical protein
VLCNQNVSSMTLRNKFKFYTYVMNHTFHIPVELQHYLRLITSTVFPPWFPQPSRRASNSCYDDGQRFWNIDEFQRSRSRPSSMCKHIVMKLQKEQIRIKVRKEHKYNHRNRALRTLRSPHLQLIIMASRLRTHISSWRGGNLAQGLSLTYYYVLLLLLLSLSSSSSSSSLSVTYLYCKQNKILCH